jgi:mono/diheme cytochrome c family protein
MSKHLTVLFLAVVATAAVYTIAQQPAPKVKDAPLPQTSPVSGQQMYASYCASCHGAQGQGNGPAAAALKTHPADLTALAKNNGGVFPSAHVTSVLRFGQENPAHGSSEMPIWGDLMLTMNPPSPSGNMQVRQRISNLTDYLKTLQK